MSLTRSVNRLLEPDEGWRPLDPAPRQGRLPPEIGKGTPKGGTREAVYRGLAYAASIPDTAGEYGEHFCYPYSGTPGDYGTRTSYFNSAAPASSGVKQSVARLLQRQSGAWSDLRRGILEGGRVFPFAPLPYWVREAGGDSDEVWTNAGDTIWTRNKAVAAYYADGDWTYRSMAFPFGQFVILVCTTGSIGWIPRSHNPKLRTDKGMTVALVSDGAYTHPRGSERSAPTAFVPHPGRVIQPAVNQSGSAFAIYDGRGWGKVYAVSSGGDGNPAATEVDAISTSFGGNYPATPISGGTAAYTWDADLSVSDSYVAALAYVADALTQITATVAATMQGSISASKTVSGSQTDFAHAGSVDRRQQETIAWGGGSLVTHDRHQTYAASAAWMQRDNGPGDWDVSYQTDVVIVEETTTREVLLLDPHNDVLLYFEAVQTTTVEFHEDHAHTAIFAGWRFRNMDASVYGFDIRVPDGQNDATLGFDPVDPPAGTETTVRKASLVLRSGGVEFRHDSAEFTQSGVSALLASYATWLGTGDTLAAHVAPFPVMQGMCPYIAYRRPGTSDAELVCAHAAAIPNLTPTTYLNSAFTEAGVVDWLTQCGAPAAVTTRVATCFRVGGA